MQLFYVDAGVRMELIDIGRNGLSMAVKTIIAQRLVNIYNNFGNCRSVLVGKIPPVK